MKPAQRSNASLQPFDFGAPAIHHETVKTAARASVLLVEATLLVWHGVMLSTPHNHADNAVPREELACSASHPSSQTSHLHGSGQAVSPHPCLACLAGSTVADAPGIAEVESVVGGESCVVDVSPDLRARFQSHLPLFRGPPLTT